MVDATKAPLSDEELKDLLREALDARDAAFESILWHLKYLTVDQCFDHCDGGGDLTRLFQPRRDRVLKIQSAINGADEGSLYRPAVRRWYDGELKRREDRWKELVEELEY